MVMVDSFSDEDALLPAAAASTSRRRRLRCRLLLLLRAAHPNFILLDVSRQLPVLFLGFAAEFVQDLYFVLCLSREVEGG